MANPCAAVLIPNIEFKTQTSNLKYAFLQIIDESSYDQARTTAGASGDIQITQLFKVGNAAASYEQFKENRKNYFQENHVDINEEESLSIVRQTVSDEARKDFVKCMNGGVGLQLWFDDDDDESAVLFAMFNGEPGSSKKVNLDLTGGLFHESNKATETWTLSSGASESEIVMRDKNSPSIKATANTVPPTRGASAVSVKIGTPPTPPLFKDRYIPDNGGYMKFDPAQKMVVSGSPEGGPSENFSITVDLPHAGTYSVDAMWASEKQTEVWVYSDPGKLPKCGDPMTGADLHYLPRPTGGWGYANLPNQPDRIGNLQLPKGKSRITFTTIPCGGGPAGGRVPSTAWIEFAELP